MADQYSEPVAMIWKRNVVKQPKNTARITSIIHKEDSNCRTIELNTLKRYFENSVPSCQHSDVVNTSKKQATSRIREKHKCLHSCQQWEKNLSRKSLTPGHSQVVLCRNKNNSVAFLRSMRRREGVPAQSCIAYCTGWMHGCNPESWQRQHFTRSIAPHLARRLVDISTHMAICSRNPSRKACVDLC